MRQPRRNIPLSLIGLRKPQRERAVERVAIGPLFNDTPMIGVYPTWFYDISVPANTQIEYKFIKIDGAGSVVWEGGMNHVYTTPASNTGEITVNRQ